MRPSASAEHEHERRWRSANGRPQSFAEDREDHRHQRDGRARRQIDAAGQDHDRRADGDDRDDRDLQHEVREIALVEEAVGRRGDEQRPPASWPQAARRFATGMKRFMPRPPRRAPPRPGPGPSCVELVRPTDGDEPPVAHHADAVASSASSSSWSEEIRITALPGAVRRLMSR